MKKIFSLFMILVIVTMALPAAPAQAAPFLPDKARCEATNGIYGSTPDGSNFCLWLPSIPYHGDLLLFAHGYMDPNSTDVPDGALPWDQLGLIPPSLPEIVIGTLHTAFAVTSYPHNGLAVREGVIAVEQLANLLKNPPFASPVALPYQIENVYLVGASEGGLVTALALEQNPNNIFKAGVSTCGPVGDFRGQVNYWGDFRVAWDYFYKDFMVSAPGPTPVMVPLTSLLPVNAINVAPQTIAAWGGLDPSKGFSLLQQAVISGLVARPDLAAKLLSVGKAPIDSAKPAETTIATTLGILDYDVRATDQARQELAGNPDPPINLFTNAGNPFGNAGRLYWGSGSLFGDFQMNQWIQAHDKYTADPTISLAPYQTSGKLKVPMVTLHTTGDPIVPYWHEPLYALKAFFTGNASRLVSIPIFRYGHCAFTVQEIMFAYVVMIFKATGSLPPLPAAIAPNSNAVLTARDFEKMSRELVPQDFKPLFIPVVR